MGGSTYWTVEMPDGAEVEVNSEEEAEALIEEVAALGYSRFTKHGKDGWAWLTITGHQQLPR